MGEENGSGENDNGEGGQETFSKEYVQNLRSEAAGFRTQLKDVKTQLEGMQTAQTEAEQAAAAQNGEFETLYKTEKERADTLATSLEGLTGQVDAFNARDEADFQTILKDVPDAFKALVSDETLPLGKRLELARAHVGVKGPLVGFREISDGVDTNTITRQAFEALPPAKRMEFVKGGGKVE